MRKQALLWVGMLWLVTGCFGHSPKAFKSLPVTATQEEREAAYKKYSVQLTDPHSPTGVVIDGHKVNFWHAQDYYERSGEIELAENTRVNLQHLSGMLATVLSGPVFMPVMSILACTHPIGYCLLFQPNHYTAPQKYNAWLRERLCLDPLATPEPFWEPGILKAEDKATGLYVWQAMRMEYLSNEDVGAFYKTKWSHAYSPEECLALGGGASLENGLTFELRGAWGLRRYIAVGWTMPDESWRKSSELEGFMHGSLELGSGYTFRIPTLRGLVLVGGNMGMGRANATRRDYDFDSGQEIGSADLVSTTVCGGPMVRFSNPILNFYSLSAELGYRWERYNRPEVRHPTGIFEHQCNPAANWDGGDVYWDFSGPYVSIVTQFGKLPFTR
jgi:hypothetical protein